MGNHVDPPTRATDGSGDGIGEGMSLVVTRASRHDDTDVDDVAYWLSRPMSERIAAVESLRRSMFGDEVGPGSKLPRIHRVVRRA